jgi:hypothetical protein
MLDAMREFDESTHGSAGQDSPLGALDLNSAPETSAPKDASLPDSPERFSTTRVATTPTDGFNVTERILSDLRSRTDSPIDRALANLLSNTRAADNDNDDPDDRAQPVDDESDRHSAGQHSQDSSATEPETADHTTDKELP